MISVIIPVWNVEKYLRQCIDSVLNQTYSDIEVLIIEDNSTDSSPQICDEYLKDSRVTVVHGKSNGLSDARNLGLDMSKGDYVTFVDSDDYLHPNMIEKMMKCFEIDEHIDMVECQLGWDKGGSIQTNLLENPFCVSGEQMVEMWFADEKPGGVPRTAVWSKIFKANLWKEKRFPTGHTNEDFFLTVQTFYESRKVYVINEPLYIHRMDNVQSLSKRPGNSVDIFLEEQFRNIMNYCADKSSGLSEISERQYYREVLFMCAKCINRKEFEKVEYLREILQKNKKRILKLENKKSMRFQYNLYYLNSFLFAKAYKLWNKL